MLPKTPKKPRKKPTLRDAFVVTAAATTAAVAGCSTVDVITNPPFVECPATTPATGSPCDQAQVGAVCDYTDECSNPITAQCTVDGWDVQYSGTCNPPPPEECPAVLPPVGDACEPAFTPPTCDYAVETSCGSLTITLSCDPGLDPTANVWTVVTQPTCDTPVTDCSTLDPTECAIYSACRYLMPGCSDEAPPPGFENGGCFAADDCTAAGCGADQDCVPVVFNPCFNSECAACGAAANVCLPTPGGA